MQWPIQSRNLTRKHLSPDFFILFLYFGWTFQASWKNKDTNCFGPRRLFVHKRDKYYTILIRLLRSLPPIGSTWLPFHFSLSNGPVSLSCVLETGMLLVPWNMDIVEYILLHLIGKDSGDKMNERTKRSTDGESERNQNSCCVVECATIWHYQLTVNQTDYMNVCRYACVFKAHNTNIPT